MPHGAKTFNRNMRLGYWNSEPRGVGPDLISIELHLKRLGDVTLTKLASLDEISDQTIDLLLIAAAQVEEGEFATWLGGVRRRLVQRLGVWLPAIVLSNVGFLTLNSSLKDASGDNWYFDIVDPDHVSSLPIRVANLLRIHDHLHELRRYENVMANLEDKVSKLEGKLVNS